MSGLVDIIASSGIANPFPTVPANHSTILGVFNIFFGIIGALSVLFVIIGGFRYVISGGNPQGTSQAKDTIIYAIIGLVVTVAATAIVNFVFGSL